ncbi:YhcN/YlaJ family sporulation lipoprotein [Brevibacillus daliensis]|uniref:YhcN/YlaJ family sporulation lipoprotein n=1 Tax=Brevibacillus daliensis TaxID=2892995 RepID=UPI001E4DE6DE|nr:YhcN/YlaJ family sporulation lipoprotein [Brevibacillus daliensis]
MDKPIKVEKIWKLVGLAMCGIALVTGCSSPTQEKNQTTQMYQPGVQGQAPIQQSEGENAHSSNVPNSPAKQLPQDKGTLAAHELHRMKVAAKRVKGVENVKVTMKGNEIFVTLDVKQQLTAGEARRIEKEVTAAIKKASKDNYQFHITSYNGFRP